MIKGRPFDDLGHLIKSAAAIWWDCDRDDWLEAFRSHPKIGGQKSDADVSGQSRAWSAQEQSSVQHASTKTLTELEQLNREYEAKFGFIFIVCASGKSPDEMLGILKSRIGNDADSELRIAAEEQAKITELRLKKLID
jgi:OHCU decarboxylase